MVDTMVGQDVLLLLCPTYRSSSGANFRTGFLHSKGGRHDGFGKISLSGFHQLKSLGVFTLPATYRYIKLGNSSRGGGVCHLACDKVVHTVRRRFFTCH